MKFLLVVAGVAALAEAKREARAFTPVSVPDILKATKTDNIS